MLKTKLVFLLLIAAQFGWSQVNDSVPKLKKDKAGYTSELEQGIASLTSFLALQDDAEAENFLRFPGLDSVATPWYKWKRKVNNNLGLQISTSYSTTGQYGENSPKRANEFASSGIFKLYTRWTLVNRTSANNGTLIINTDHRHKYTNITPAKLGFEIGYNGIPALLFSDAKFMVLELTWQQKFNNGNTGIIIGRYDPNDYFDVLGYVNPFTTFQNLSILVNASIALADTSTGIGIGHWINDQFGIQATVNDVNSTANKFTFFEDFGELYTSAEVLWTPSKKDRFFKNFHITYWHADAREKANIEESRGFTVGGNWTFHETFMPFFKVGWSTGSAPIYSQSYTGGFIIKPNLNKDLIGFGVNFGETQSENWQFSSEIFYRFQISQNFAVTPNVQYFKNPDLDPNLDNAFVIGLRGRIAL